ncbi:MAG TPA: hypothetical protein PLB25_19825 [Rhodoferax sp.]|nr:hypothetical protein [Rhodoferax sp.]
MSIIFFLRSLFRTPEFRVGGRVNAIRDGHIERSDGYVVAQTDLGVLVEWPCGGTSVVSASDLSVIG